MTAPETAAHPSPQLSELVLTSSDPVVAQQNIPNLGCVRVRPDVNNTISQSEAITAACYDTEARKEGRKHGSQGYKKS